MRPIVDLKDVRDKLVHGYREDFKEEVPFAFYLSILEEQYKERQKDYFLGRIGKMSALHIKEFMKLIIETQTQTQAKNEKESSSLRGNDKPTGKKAR